MNKKSSANDAVVREMLTQILELAEYHARLVLAFFDRMGIQLPSVELLSEAEATQVNAMLLELGSALQIAVWDRVGLRANLPDFVPSVEQALVNAGRAFDAAGISDSTGTGNRSQFNAVWRTWRSKFVLGGRREGFGEVMIDFGSGEELLAAFVEFLWDAKDAVTVAKEV